MTASADGQPDRLRVGVVGLGRMGAAMARALLTSGADVIAWSRASALTVDQELGSFRQVGSLGELAAETRLILLSLADERALEAVVNADSAMLSHLVPGTVVADMSTVGERAALRAAGEVVRAGGRYVDAPVSGSTASIEQRQLLILASGSSQNIDACRPAWGAFAKAVLEVGPVGAGQSLKVALNGALHSFNAAVSEALVVAERKGVDRQAAYGAFELSALGAPFLTYKRAAFLAPDETNVAFALQLVAKDLALARALAEEAGTPSGQCDAAAELVRSAVEAGLGDQDMAYLAQFLRASIAD